VDWPGAPLIEDLSLTFQAAAGTVKSTWIASYGNTICPLEFFFKIPLRSKAWASPWTVFTSLPTSRAAARRDIGPLPAIAPMSWQRGPQIVFHKRPAVGNTMCPGSISIANLDGKVTFPDATPTSSSFFAFMLAIIPTLASLSQSPA